MKRIIIGLLLVMLTGVVGAEDRLFIYGQDIHTYFGKKIEGIWEWKEYKILEKVEILWKVQRVDKSLEPIWFNTIDENIRWKLIKEDK